MMYTIHHEKNTALSGVLLFLSLYAKPSGIAMGAPLPTAARRCKPWLAFGGTAMTYPTPGNTSAGSARASGCRESHCDVDSD